MENFSSEGSLVLAFNPQKTFPKTIHKRWFFEQRKKKRSAKDNFLFIFPSAADPLGLFFLKEKKRRKREKKG
jgi:hypothetical protein